MAKEKLTRESIEQCVQMAQVGVCHRDMAKAIGVSESSFYKWLNHPNSDNQRELVRRLDEVSSTRTEFLLRCVQTAARDKDWKAAAWLLERENPRRYARPEIQAQFEAVDSMESAQDGTVRDFGLLIGSAFLRPHRLMAQRALTDFWMGGGRGSLKSSWAALELVNHIETNPEHHALVMMKYQNHLKRAAFNQVMWALDKIGVADSYKCNPSALEIIRKATDQRVYFSGCDDPDKVKSITPKFGYIGFVWFEEADMFRGMAEVRKVTQSAVRGGDDFVRVYTFNPPRSVHSWINQEVQRRKDDGAEVFASTYLEAPPEWLGRQFIEDAEELKRADRKAYDHEYMGIPVGVGAEVFDPERVVFREIPDSEIKAFDNVKAGQDFGWYPDPWAFTLSEWNQARRELITFYEDGGNKLQPDQQAARIAEAMKRFKLEGTPVWSDDASPQAIQAQFDWGVNARPAGKGGLRDASYQFIQSSTWVIDPRRCPHLAEEVRNMQYEVAKDGTVMNSIPDGNDHYIDATRYALMQNVRRFRAAYRKE